MSLRSNYLTFSHWILGDDSLSNEMQQKKTEKTRIIEKKTEKKIKKNEKKMNDLLLLYKELLMCGRDIESFFKSNIDFHCQKQHPLMIQIMYIIYSFDSSAGKNPYADWLISLLGQSFKL